jgi:putative CocE/NonD family hydrolase
MTMPVHSSLNSPTPRSQSAFTAIGVRIPMRDGLSLHAAVWRPRGQTEPVSAVMELTPYGIDHLNEDGVFWAAEGFAYVAIDVRGRGNSDGDFVPFLRDASDGYDAVEWIAAQDWCDGKVALHGGSYTGVNQYLILAAAPPSLKAITPDSTSGFGVDLPRGGIPALYDFGWRRLVSNRGTQFTIAGDIAHWHRHLYDAAVAGTSLVEAAVAAGAPLDEWVLEPVDHAEPGPRWEVYWAQPEQLAATTVPVLSITGMYDDSSGGTIYNWRRFARHAPAGVVAASHLVVGPWDHMGTHFGEGTVGELVFGPDAAVNLPELRRDWLRHILHGAPPPEFLRDRVMLYLAGAERWISAPSLEQATSGSVTRYLRSADGPMDATHSGFVEDAPAASPDATFTCDPFDMRTHEAELQPRPAGSGPESPFHGQPMNNFLMSVAGNDPTNPRPVLDLDGQGVVYTSRILTDGITIIGEPELHVRLVCDQPDADLVVLLHEITPMGDSIFLSSDALRLSCRRLDGTHHYLVPGEPTDVTFREFKWCTRTVQAGSRLRLAIRHAYAIQLTPYGHGRPADAPAAHVRIHHDAASAPRLILPTGAP